jgi:hypothetical protein
MKAIQYRSYGDYTENRFVDLPQPELRDGEVMRTVGINPLDNAFRSGHFYGQRLKTSHASAVRRRQAQSSRARVMPSTSAIACLSGAWFGIMTDGTVLQYSIDGSMKWTCSPCGKVTCFMVGGSY